jgi:peptidyl-prolyl cis-trans isomerase-like protein 2
MFDEEELMFDAIQNPAKAKKEKDVGKRRAYVRVVTSLGGSLNLELFCEKVRNIDRIIILVNLVSGPQDLL